MADADSVPERCVSYVVSRSGKVLDSSGRVLESENQVVSQAAAGDCSEPRPIAACEGNAENFYSLASSALKALAPSSQASRKRKSHGFARPEEPRKKQRSTVTWEDEIGSLSDIVRAILWKKGGGKGRVLSVTNKLQTSENTSSDGTDYGERARRLEQRLRVAMSQMLILQRWEPGSREVPAKWASWLLKMLRKARPLPQALQRFLFTVSGAILPLMCCSLVCQTLTILPDIEVLRSVDVLCLALCKSRSCFSSFQWEILEDRIVQCQHVRLSAGTWMERGSCRSTKPKGEAEASPGRGRSCSSSSNCTLSNDERSLLASTPPTEEDKARSLLVLSPETAARSSSSTPEDSDHLELCNGLLALVETEHSNSSEQRPSNVQRPPIQAGPATGPAKAEVKEGSLEMPGPQEVSLDALVGNVLQKNDCDLIKPAICWHSSALAPGEQAYCKMRTS